MKHVLCVCDCKRRRVQMSVWRRLVRTVASMHGAQHAGLHTLSTLQPTKRRNGSLWSLQSLGKRTSARQQLARWPLLLATHSTSPSIL